MNNTEDNRSEELIMLVPDLEHPECPGIMLGYLEATKTYIVVTTNIAGDTIETIPAKSFGDAFCIVGESLKKFPTVNYKLQ